MRGLVLLLFFRHGLFGALPETIFKHFLMTLFRYFIVYYDMRNFCNLIGLEQWYFSLI